MRCKAEEAEQKSNMYNRVRTTERRDEGGSKLSGSKNLVASRGINRFFRVGMAVVVAI